MSFLLSLQAHFLSPKQHKAVPDAPHTDLGTYPSLPPPPRRGQSGNSVRQKQPSPAAGGSAGSRPGGRHVPGRGADSDPSPTCISQRREPSFRKVLWCLFRAAPLARGVETQHRAPGPGLELLARLHRAGCGSCRRESARLSRAPLAARRRAARRLAAPFCRLASFIHAPLPDLALRKILIQIH